MIAVLQINLHHSRAATATLCQKILTDGVVLIQEPWTVKGRVMGMSTAKGKLIYDTQCDKPRACIFVNKNIKALKITHLCSRDIVVTEVHLQTESAGRQLKLRNTSSSIVLPCAEEEARIWKWSRRTEDR
nr:unnamed protein product [Callosobruchus chinensis]